jgi:hypothetical protein
MKKLFSLFVAMTIVFGLSACAPQDDSVQISDLEKQVTNLTDQLQNEDELQSQIASLEEQVMDVQVELTVRSLYGTSITKQYGFTEDSVPTLADLLQMAFGATVVPSAYGSYLAGFSTIEVPYGSYIQISQDNVPATVGLDDLVIEDGSSFQFDVVWYDSLQEKVFNALQLFISNQLDNYLSSDFIDYNVLLGCDGLCDNAISDEEINTYLDSVTLDSVASYFKAIVIANHLEDQTRSLSLVSELNNMVDTGPYGQTALGLIALDSFDHGIDYSSYVANALSYYQTNTPVSEGLDAGGFGVIALSSYTDESGVADLIDAYVDYVKTNQLDSGGIKTADVEWGGTVYPGTENAATMSQVILALISTGVDPTGPDFTKGDMNLVLRLLDFQLEDGTFDWDLTDDVNGDSAFSTPQAFLALSTYYRYVNSYGDINNPFIK